MLFFYTTVILAVALILALLHIMRLNDAISELEDSGARYRREITMMHFMLPLPKRQKETEAAKEA